MNETLSAKTPRIRTRRPTFWNSILPEGPAVFVLLLLANVIPALATQRANWDHLITPVATISVIGFLVGVTMARVGVLDSMSHIMSVLMGSAVSYLFVLAAADQFGPGMSSRVKPAFWHIRDWYFGNNNPQQNDDVVLSLLLGLIVWMLGYLSAWVLFRRGWLLMAVLLPGLLLLLNLGYAPDPEPLYTFAFLAIVVPLTARFHLFKKQVVWSRYQMAGPRSLSVKFLGIGAVLAILVTSAGWNAPDSVSQESLQPVISELGQQIESARHNANEWLTRSNTGKNGSESGNAFSDFEDSFSIGGELNLSNEPEVLVNAENSPYLSAQHYNVYSDNGWSSNVEDTFDPDAQDGQTYEPAMLFRAGQQVVISEPSASNRSSVTAQIQPLKSGSSIMLTIETYVGANVDSSVKMSWIQFEEAEFDLNGSDFSAVPPDLANIVNILRTMTLTEGGGLFGPVSTDGKRNRQLETERGALANRFLEVRWEADGNGNLTKLIVSGQVPVYDDVESVSRRGDTPDDGYVVEGSVSDASPADLRDTSTDYPEWVAQRYLQLPNTITPRTSDLVQQITAQDDTVYEKAKSIEEYLRTNITYDTNVGSPPEDQDIVDYLLFDNSRGYCEHYATAMTVMLRSLGIPARVAAGYAPGEYDPEQGRSVYLQSDAHAWVEVYFPDYGWVPFEPTTTESTRELGTDADAEDATDVEVTPESSPTAEAPETNQDATPTPTSEPDQPALAPILNEGGGDSGNSTAMIIGGIVAGAVVASVVVWWLWMRRLRGLSISAGLFARLLRLGRFFGIRPKPSTTPAEYASSLSERLPMARGYAESIVYAYELDQYAESGSNDRVKTAAVDAWKHVRTSMIPAILEKFIPRRRRSH